MGQHADDALNEALDYDIDDVCFGCGEPVLECRCYPYDGEEER